MAKFKVFLSVHGAVDAETVAGATAMAHNIKVMLDQAVRDGIAGASALYWVGLDAVVQVDTPEKDHPVTGETS